MRKVFAFKFLISYSFRYKFHKPKLHYVQKYSGEMDSEVRSLARYGDMSFLVNPMLALNC